MLGNCLQSGYLCHYKAGDGIFLRSTAPLMRNPSVGPHIYLHGLFRWCSGKESACQCRRRGFDPWVGKILRRRKWQPIPIYLPGKSHGQRSLAGYSPWGYKESTWLFLNNNNNLHTQNIRKPSMSWPQDSRIRYKLSLTVCPIEIFCKCFVNIHTRNVHTVCI